MGKLAARSSAQVLCRRLDVQGLPAQVLTAAPPLVTQYCQNLDVELGPLGGALQHLLQTIHGACSSHASTDGRSCSGNTYS